MEYELKRIVDLAVEAGRILLSNGAEIFRVDETITRICDHFEVDHVDTFVLSHGIFISADKGGQEVFSKVRHVPLSGTNLAVVAEVNDLSRRIVAGQVGLEDAERELERIRNLPVKKDWVLILASGVGSGTFGYFLGANGMESLCAFFIGCILYIWVLFAGRHKLSKMVVNIVGGILITTLAVVLYKMVPAAMKIDEMIIASILPLVPGVAFVNAIRDIADSDFLSGTVRMMDAVLVFVYIAIGVGVALSIFSKCIGGLGV